MTTLRVIFGDQLNESISSLSDTDKDNDIILFFEVNEEATYIKHHKKKIILIFSAMRHFAKELSKKNYAVHYIKIDDKENTGSFHGEVQRAIKHYQPQNIILTEPSEYRVYNKVKQWANDFNVAVEIRSDNRFLCSHKTFKQWAQSRKQLRMEFFYREMRKQYNILMDNGQPEGGKWNYDADNRKPLKGQLSVPDTYHSKTDVITKNVIDWVDAHYSDHFGSSTPFHFAVTHKQASQALNQFIDERLASFGDYQDAMVQNEPWLYHSHIGFYLNCGLLLPLQCIKQVEQAYRQNKVPLNAAEGFIRQILGWREYVRGIYWLKMPEYEKTNHLNAQRKLPGFFWGKSTRMNCISQCISETHENAYAHHIQRLMVLGNFLLLAGIDPDEVNHWYMIVYADAFQWVELPNVSGMVLYADGGLLSSKPYAASGAYINKMSDYCKGCHYKVSKKDGDLACPFNYLYWNFFIKNKATLKNNPRLGMSYRTLAKMSDEKIDLIETDSERFLNAIEANALV